MMNITVTKNPNPGKLPPADQLGFGSVFTDHMFLMDYTEKDGWHNARIVPFGPISMSPAASVLHYGTEVFEGLKAYRASEPFVRPPWPSAHQRRRWPAGDQRAGKGRFCMGSDGSRHIPIYPPVPIFDRPDACAARRA